MLKYEISFILTMWDVNFYHDSFSNSFFHPFILTMWDVNSMSM